ncbi:hypothetical protein AXFE_10150 [Acidithrix ferrooxidans]|uniref:Uncharacterized protein n=1 Tax=Acidithrix ferrooxidans TaxID=1280514 RepID=A0A0D8HJQ0_9ACTN|nr:hypothetical protein AXFE_10150 [Acidithrix ferrooxidans]
MDKNLFTLKHSTFEAEIGLCLIKPNVRDRHYRHNLEQRG